MHRLPPWRTVLNRLLMLAAAMGASSLLLASCGPDIKPTPGGPSAPIPVDIKPGAPVIGVRLGGSTSQAELSISGPFALRAGPPGSEFPVVLRTSGNPAQSLKVSRGQGQWQIGDVRSAQPVIVLEPAGRAIVGVGGGYYRGRIRLVSTGPETFLVVNDVDLESYLASVVPKEMYAHWHQQALRAQAVASRTFALYQMRTFGRSRPYDVRNNQSSQVYRGLATETRNGWQAVAGTHGKVLAIEGPDGQPRIFRAQYSSCCGGRVNPADVVQNSPEIAPLRGGQVCEDCSASTKYRWPTVGIVKTAIYQAVRKRYPSQAKPLRDLAEVRVVEATEWGRPIWLDVRDSGGKVLRLRADDLRMAMIMEKVPGAKKLFSMNCRIVNTPGRVLFAEGKGFGHGIGLCQWGAQGKAKRGWSFERILGFYYPGAEVVSVY
jgi:stage II sporulation protein D